MYYPYTNRDLIESPITYEFSQYCGIDGLKAYEADRENMLSFLATIKGGTFEQELPLQPDNNDIFYSEFTFRKLLQKLKSNRTDEEDYKLIELFIKKFEVSKKLWTMYTKNNYQKMGEDDNLQIYCLFANILGEYYDLVELPEKKMIAFNVLLKINDTLSAVKEKLLERQRLLAVSAIKKEKDIYSAILSEVNI